MAFSVGRVVLPVRANPRAYSRALAAYTACRSCSFVSLALESALATTCPCCGSAELEHTSFVTPSGFAPDINEKREVDRGDPIVYAGLQSELNWRYRRFPPNGIDSFTVVG